MRNMQSIIIGYSIFGSGKGEKWEICNTMKFVLHLYIKVPIDKPRTSHYLSRYPLTSQGDLIMSN